MFAAVAGLAAILNANPLILRALQWFGGAYLCWMGVQLLRARIGGEPSVAEPERSARVYFRQAVAVSLTNPKVVLFFTAFFPLFLRPGAPLSTLIVMMAHVTILSLIYQALLVVAGNSAATRLKALPWVRKAAHRLAGIALVVFGLKLVLDNR
jgi:threonine/homoserine/homoserine lactone efflux protein